MNKLINTICNPPWLFIIGWAITVGTFYWKLNTDTKYARYRETVAYIEKLEESMRKKWGKISDRSVNIEDKSDEVYAFFAQLELISLLVKKKAFDEELVYNFWWRYFDAPLKSKEINTWLMFEQASDQQVFSRYLELCRKWTKQIDLEQGSRSVE